MKKKARSSKSKKSNRTSKAPSARPPSAVANAKTDSTPPSAPTLAAMGIAPRVSDPDEISVPPVVAIVHDEAHLDDTFFTAPRAVKVGHAALAHDDDEPISQKMTPRVQARRERFSKYVKGTVAVAVAVCAMAMIRTSIGGSHKDSDPTPSAAAEPRATPVAAAAPLAAPEPPKAAHVPLDVPPPPAEVTAPAETKPDAKLVETHAAEVPKAVPAVEAKPADPVSTKTALEEKRTSGTMLERGKIAAAIESGERAVALDPTDGEAWLILGAAYQEKGRTVEARKAFTSCIQQGKKGPLGECRAMLR